MPRVFRLVPSGTLYILISECRTQNVFSFQLVMICFESLEYLTLTWNVELSVSTRNFTAAANELPSPLVLWFLYHSQALATTGMGVVIYQFVVYPWLANTIGLVNVQCRGNITTVLMMAALPYLTDDGAIYAFSAVAMMLSFSVSAVVSMAVVQRSRAYLGGFIGRVDFM